MHEDTLRRLNAINAAFYQQTAAHFDATRQQPWPGWARLLPHLPARRPLRVLDVGCGNGRFGVWLAGQGAGPLHYHGTDNSPALLGYARAALATLDRVQLTPADLLADPLPGGPFDLVALFGVLHHVPGAAQRERLLAALGARVAPGGVLAVAVWRFADNPRFLARALDWPADLEREPGDYLLDWRRGTVAARYCHHVDDAEGARLVAASGLDEIDRYRADGHDGRTNQYHLLRGR